MATRLVLIASLMCSALAASAQQNTVDHPKGYMWISELIRAGGKASVGVVQVRLSILQPPPPPVPPDTPEIWHEIETKSVAVGHLGRWTAIFDVLDHPGYGGWVSCPGPPGQEPSIITGWDFEDYKVDLIIGGVVQDSSEFSIVHDCLGPELSEPPPGEPPGGPGAPPGNSGAYPGSIHLP